MAAATTIGGRSEFSQSEAERDVEREVNARLAPQGMTRIMLYTREKADGPVFFAVISAGSRRKTLQRERPFLDADELVQLAEGFAGRAQTARRGAQWTEDPDEADADAFV